MRIHRGTSALLISLVFLSTVLLAWWFRTIGPDPKVAAVRETANQLFENLPTKPEEFKNMRRQFTELHQQVEELSSEQRASLMRGPPPFFKSLMRQVETYARLPAAEKRRFMDQRIDEMEAMRQGMQQFFPGGPPQMPQMDPGDMRRGFLDNTTAQQRASLTVFMQDMEQRRSQRGLEPLPAPPF